MTLYRLSQEEPRVSLGTCFIAPNASLIGSVTLGEKSSVWFGAVLRGDVAQIKVGNESNIQDNSVLHAEHNIPTHIGDRVTIGHRAIVHGCVIQDECLIGMGSIILNGAHIESHCLIAAGSLVLENSHIPKGSVVMGSPGRVVRSVTPEEEALFRQSAANYVAYALEYLEYLKALTS